MSAQLYLICNHTNETATKWYLFQSTRGFQQAIDKVYKHPYASTGSSEWAIPENIHTIPRTALRISEGEGGFTIMEF